MTGSQGGGTIKLPTIRWRAVLRAAVLAVAVFLPAAAQVTTPAPSVAANGVWLADHKTLKQIDPAGHGVIQTYRLERKPRALALDPDDNTLWVLTQQRLLKFDGQANLLREVELADLTQGTTHASGESDHADKKKHHKDRKKAKNKKSGLTEATRLALNPFDRSLWIAGERTLLHLDSEGALLEVVESPGHIDAIALGLDESLWVLGRRQLWQVVPDGSLTEPLNLPELIDRFKDDHADDHGHARGHGNSKRTRFMALDSVGQVLWLANQRHLARINLKDSNDAAVVYHAVNDSQGAHSDKEGRDDRKRENDHEDRHRKKHKHTDVGLIRDLTINPRDGTLWLVNKEELISFGRSGTPDTAITLPDELPKPEILIFDPANPSLWLAGRRTAAHFDANGHLLGTVALEKNAEALAVTPFHLRPELSLLEPPDGVGTNNPGTAIRLSLAARCNGTPCEVGQAYTEVLQLDARLNGAPVGDLFKINSGEARYQPGLSLADGIYEFTAQAIDAFGHASNPISSRFTVDTIPPRFIDLTPAHGSTLNTEEITIEGRVDEPATVILTYPDGAMTVGSESFAFALTLTPGLNNFTLLARDFAGNETQIPLTLTLSTLSVSIASPTSGASVSANSILVSGTFEAPANTGVTVNGAIAHTFGSQFFATVPLVAGQNVITATATSADGVATSDSVSVTNTLATGAESDLVQVLASPESGIAPLSVTFTLTNSTASPIQSIDIDFDGDGTTDATTTNSDTPIEHTYVTPGVFQATSRVTDGSGGVHTATHVIVVNTFDDRDQMLRSVYTGMLDRLRAGDIEAALSAITGGMRSKYEAIFTALKSNLATVVDQLGTIERVVISQDFAELTVVREKNGERRAYLIYLLRSEDGVWRIESM